MSEGREPGFRPWWLAVPVLTAAIQLANKMIALRTAAAPFGPAWFARAATTPWTAVMIAGQLASLILWLRILSTVPVSKALPLTAVSYLLIIAMSCLLFHEPIQAAEIGGTCLILVGVGLIVGQGDEKRLSV